MSGIFDRDRLRNIDTIVMVAVCWNCQYLQAELGRYKSSGPRCGECGERLDTYKVVG